MSDLQPAIASIINRHIAEAEVLDGDQLAQDVLRELGLSRQSLYINDTVSSPLVTRWVTRWEIADDG